MSEAEQIERFLQAGWFAVVGASSNREKYGNKVLRAYQQSDLEVFPVHPKAREIEGLQAYPSLTELLQSQPEKLPPAVSVITPPRITEGIIEEVVALGIEHVWLQPGAESDAAIETAARAKINMIANGPCVLVQLRFRDI